MVRPRSPLQICSTGKFRGDVSFGSIVVENGGKLEGRVNFDGLRAVPQTSSASQSQVDPVSVADVTKEVVSAESDASDPPTTPPPSRVSTSHPPPRPSTSATIADEIVQEETLPPVVQEECPKQETSPADEEPSPVQGEPCPAQEETCTSHEVSPKPKTTPVVVSTSLEVQEEPIASETSRPEPITLAES